MTRAQPGRPEAADDDLRTLIATYDRTTRKLDATAFDPSSDETVEQIKAKLAGC